MSCSDGSGCVACRCTQHALVYVPRAAGSVAAESASAALLRSHEGSLSTLRRMQWPKVHQELSTRPAPANPMVAHGAAAVTVGKPRDWPSYGWDNEYGRRALQVPPFAASRFQVTNGEFAEFVRAGGYRDESLWSSDGWRWCAPSFIPCLLLAAARLPCVCPPPRAAPLRCCVAHVACCMLHVACCNSHNPVQVFTRFQRRGASAQQRSRVLCGGAVVLRIWTCACMRLMQLDTASDESTLS